MIEILKKGSQVCFSTVGAYKIQYPEKENMFELSADVKVEALPWITPYGYEVYKLIYPKELVKATVIWYKKETK